VCLFVYLIVVFFYFILPVVGTQKKTSRWLLMGKFSPRQKRKPAFLFEFFPPSIL